MLVIDSCWFPKSEKISPSKKKVLSTFTIYYTLCTSNNVKNLHKKRFEKKERKKFFSNLYRLKSNTSYKNKRCVQQLFQMNQVIQVLWVFTVWRHNIRILCILSNILNIRIRSLLYPSEWVPFQGKIIKK